ncbi:MAG: hypothetical protein AAFW89_14640 [Bacteroidota bacterium]
MKTDKYLARCIRIYVVCALFLTLLCGYVAIEPQIASFASPHIGWIDTVVIRYLLFGMLMAYYLYAFFETRIYYYLSIPYVLLLSYVAVLISFYGFDIF